MNIVLCGMPASGKSTIARQLGYLTGHTVVDTDTLITQRYGEIPALFEKFGEQYFRSLESEVVLELSKEDNLIIATGGGTVLKNENVEALRQNGKIVYLKVKLSTLIERAQRNKGRPLLRGNVEQRVKKLWEERKPLYERAADIVVECDGHTATENAQMILNLMEKYL